MYSALSGSKFIHFIFQNVSIDSGRGTMSTVTTRSSKMSNTATRSRPKTGVHSIPNNIPEDKENSIGENDRSVENHFARREMPALGNPAQRHPPSPPVRLRERY